MNRGDVEERNIGRKKKGAAPRYLARLGPRPIGFGLRWFDHVTELTPFIADRFAPALLGSFQEDQETSLEQHQGRRHRVSEPRRPAVKHGERGQHQGRSCRFDRQKQGRITVIALNQEESHRVLLKVNDFVPGANHEVAVIHRNGPHEQQDTGENERTECEPRQFGSASGKRIGGNCGGAHGWFPPLADLVLIVSPVFWVSKLLSVKRGQGVTGSFPKTSQLAGNGSLDSKSLRSAKFAPVSAPGSG